MYLFAALISCLLAGSVYSAANCGTSGTANCELICQNTSLTSAAPTATATACTDTRSDCGSIFNCSTDTAACEDPTAYTAFNISDPTTYPKYRAALCDNPASQDIALECAKTCMICCETSSYNCVDDDSGVVDCAANMAKCTDANWTDIMAQYCPATCGLCENGTCTDVNSGCSGLATLCKNVDWVTYMEANCARTCDTCNSTSSTSNCTDLASNCAANSNLCNNTLYATLMAQECCATCASTSSSGAVSCTDSSTSCSTWNSNGFCASSFYTTAEKQQYCASTCGLCSG